MKTIRVIVCIILVVFGTKAFGREKYQDQETFGNTLNVGMGLAYYKHIGETVPVGHINYEIDIADNITLAPFVTYFAHHDFAYPDKNSPLFRHYYRESVIPVGVTGIYYFDDLLSANDNWDFYAGLSLGAQITRRAWADGYIPTTTVAKGSAAFYFDGHIGAEFHLSYKIGFTVDLSKGISMAGVAVHF